jgi:SET domain-containing protein
MYDCTPWLDPRISVAPSSIQGLGLFARKAIAEGEVVVRLGGEVLTDEEFRARTLNLTKYSALAIDDRLHLLIDDDSPTNFGNHSCDANLWMADAVTLIARRPIMAGEEVTVDYATHTADLTWSMTCNCGSPHCRRVVTNDDWRRPDVQERYAGHFSPFLNRRIAAGGV